MGNHTGTTQFWTSDRHIFGISQCLTRPDGMGWSCNTSLAGSFDTLITLVNWGRTYIDERVQKVMIHFYDYEFGSGLGCD